MIGTRTKYLYFSTGDGANATGEACYFPVTSFLGFDPSGTTALDMYFTSLKGDNAYDKVTLTITTNTHKIVMDSILEVINLWKAENSAWTDPGEPELLRSVLDNVDWRINVCDKDNDIFLDGNISDCTITYGTCNGCGGGGGSTIPVKVDGTSLTTELTSIDYVDGITATNSGTGDITVKPDRYTDGGIKLDGGKLRLDLSETNITGTLPTSRGGTGGTGGVGVTSVGGTGTVNGLTMSGTVTSTGNLTLGGTLAVNNGDWSGTDLSVANGGTGASTLTTNGVLIGNGTSAVTSVDMSTKGDILVGDGSGNPSMLSIGSNNNVLTVASGTASWAAPKVYYGIIPLHIPSLAMTAGQRSAINMNMGKTSTATGNYPMGGTGHNELIGNNTVQFSMYDDATQGTFKWIGCDVFIAQNVSGGTGVELDIEICKLAHSGNMGMGATYTHTVTSLNGGTAVGFSNNTEYKKISYNSGFPSIGGAGFYTFSIHNRPTSVGVTIIAHVVLKYQIES